VIAEALARPRAERVAAPAPVRRRFLRVGARRVHYLRAGDGPPAVLVHSSPANATLLAPEIAALSRDYTVFAFDTPGFGRSDPLPLDEMTVADLADAMADTLQAMAMPPCPVYGTHTGAAIALEFGARHPERVTGLVLDGVPAFTTQEFDTLFGGYFRAFPVSDLGGHYTDLWTRFRDQYAWFPWTARHPDARNPYDLGTPENVHTWVSMYFDAAEHYMPAYRAALRYGQGAIAAAARLQRPAIYCATETDMLHGHLKRLPPMKPGQEVRSISPVPAAKHAVIAEGFARFGSPGLAPADRDGLDGSGGVGRQFLDRASGGQTHLRFAGRPDAAPILLLHDAPGSSAQLEPLVAALGADRFVIAPDLPGCGESDPLDGERPAMAQSVAALDALLEGLKIARTDVYGVGFGASAAVALARAHPGRVAGLVLEGLLLPTAEERAALSADYAPPIAIAPDGSHWYRTWLMLRDSLVWWPWNTRRAVNQRRRPGDFDAQRLHRLTVDVMRRRATYGHPIHAALEHDAAADLKALSWPLARLTDGATPLSAYDAELRALIPDTPEARAEDDPLRQAQLIQRLGRTAA
jgi:pimeloyl-ACP methyl ester carboxylesterase